VVPVAVVVVVVLTAWLAITYNGLVRRRNRVDSTWSDIDVLLRRRHDLVPNLVMTVGAYAAHEASILRAATNARAAAIAALAPAAKGVAESALGSTVRSVFALAEAYPNLKASEAYVRLQQQLTETEDGLEHARQFYNDAVYGYMNASQTLPTSVVAGMFGFGRREYFQAPPSERAVVAARP
jgi:LemA protein